MPGAEEDQGKLDDMLVPVVDFANFSMQPNAQCGLDEQGGFQIVASRDLAVGEEVTIRYGRNNSEQMLFTSGFFPADVPSLCTSPLAMEGADGDELVAKVLRFVVLERTWDSDIMAAQLARSPNGEVDASELWAVANVLGMTAQELRRVAASIVISNRLPDELHARASPTAMPRLRELLDEWSSELKDARGPLGRCSSWLFGGFGGSRFAAVRAYRSDCRSLVEGARRRLAEEERVARS